MPFLAVDLGGIHLVSEVELTFSEQLPDPKSMEVRVGNEGSFVRDDLITVNSVCEDVDGEPETSASAIKITCSSSISGQFVSLQRTECGSIRLDAIAIGGKGSHRPHG